MKACSALLLLCGCALPPTAAAPIGPITGIAVTDSAVASCSQRGVGLGLEPAMRVLPAPARAFDIAATADPAEWLCGGGTPAATGVVWLQRGETALSIRDLADDIVTSVAAAGELGAAGCADGRVVTFALHGDTAPTERQRHTAACRSVAFAPDGRLLASGGRDGLLLLHDLGAHTTQICTGAIAAIECVRFAAAGDSIAAGCADGRVRLFARDGRLLRSWQRLGGSVLALAETPRGWCAGIDDGRLLCLHRDRETAEELGRFASPIHALASSDGQLLLGLHGALLAVPLPAAAP